MPREIFTFRKKIILTFSYILLIVALVLSSNYLNLNETSQRYLVKALKIPENFIENISQEFKEYESLKIVDLENEIIKLKNDIYESELKVRSLENSKSYNTNITTSKSTKKSYVSAFDQVNFSCCKKHVIYLQAENTSGNQVFSVSQGDFIIGKTNGLVANEFKVRLLSDPEEFISLKNSKNFYCIAQGNGLPQETVCFNESKASTYEIGDTFFSTGFDGIYPKNLIAGKLTKIEIVEGNMFKEKLTIELFFDPYQSIDKGVTLYD